jgi:hypothetical protein
LIIESISFNPSRTWKSCYYKLLNQNITTEIHSSLRVSEPHPAGPAFLQASAHPSECAELHSGTEIPGSPERFPKQHIPDSWCQSTEAHPTIAAQAVMQLVNVSVCVEDIVIVPWRLQQSM